MLQGVWQALNCLSIYATYCMIIAGASPRETKLWAAVRENDDFFAFAVRITGKLLKIDGYMLRGVWQALNCLSIHAKYCVIIAGASLGETKRWLWYVKTTISCTCGCRRNRPIWRFVANHYNGAIKCIPINNNE